MKLFHWCFLIVTFSMVFPNGSFLMVLSQWYFLKDNLQLVFSNCYFPNGTFSIVLSQKFFPNGILTIAFFQNKQFLTWTFSNFPNITKENIQMGNLHFGVWSLRSFLFGCIEVNTLLHKLFSDPYLSRYN